MKKKKWQLVSSDWKDIDDLLSSLQGALKDFGLYMTDDPAADGSDQIQFFISNWDMTLREAKKIDKDMGWA